MALFFKKNPPKACPKCGKADGWRALPAEPAEDYVNPSAAVNPFASAPIRGTFGQNMTGTVGRKSKKIRFHCDGCGFEKSY